jgi:hypothetical protein
VRVKAVRGENRSIWRSYRWTVERRLVIIKKKQDESSERWEPLNPTGASGYTIRAAGDDDL